jgi:hypothetical protein
MMAKSTLPTAHKGPCSNFATWFIGRLKVKSNNRTNLSIRLCHDKRLCVCISLTRKLDYHFDDSKETIVDSIRKLPQLHNRRHLILAWIKMNTCYV